MKKVLVTGADGFIGSHLTESLLEKGYDVKAFTFYNSFNTWGWLDTLPKEKLREIEIFSGDVRDPNGVREAPAWMRYFIWRRSLQSRSATIHRIPMWIPTSRAL